MKAFESRPAIEYPRKRASIACNFCRHRKRKCDGQKPTCGLCTDAGAQCVYQESDRVQDIPAEILVRLSHLETLIEQQKDAITELSNRIGSPSSHSDQFSHRSNASMFSSQPRYDWDPSPEHLYDKSSFGLFAQDNLYNQEYTFTIPPGHHTPAGSLFSLDLVKNLVGDYPQDFFKQIEKKRPFNSIQLAGVPQSVDQIDTSRLHPHVTKPLINEFLTHVHPFFPAIDPQLLNRLFETFSAYNKVNNIQTPLYLVILALGKVSSNPQRIFDIEAERDLNGMEYFAPAYHHLTNPLIRSLGADHLLPLALLYASLYLRFIGRPIQAWEMIRDASCSVYLAINELHDGSTYEERAIVYRTAWGCFILECDDLAEFHFPPSSIETLVEKLPFPGISEDSRHAHTLFLAMCSIRKILNRVHSTLYAKPHQENFQPESSPQSTSETSNATPPKHSIASLKTISEELDRQVENWLDNIPGYVMPPLGNALSADHPFQTHILARYYATKYIICRPSLFFAAYTQSGTVLPEFVFANCKKCVESCRQLIWAAARLLRRRTYATWLRMQSMLAAIFTLSIARTTPSLEALVPDFDDLVKEAIQCIEPWAHHSETADTILSMLKTIRQKVRVSLRA